MRGASALNALLGEFPDSRLQVMVVWEPVLLTDISPPVTRVLGLLDDARVTQHWDPGRVVSSDIVRSVNVEPVRYGLEEPLPPGYIAWDVVAVFDSSAGWERDLPAPAYYGGPVEDVIAETRKALADALTRSAAR